jgi:hypothetical protein
LSVSKLFEGLVDDVIDRAKLAIDEYMIVLKRDIEVFVDQLLRRAAKTIALGVFGASLLSVGAIFALIGLVNFLSHIFNPAAAWAIVGLGTMAAGGAALFLSLRGLGVARKGGYDPRNGHNGNGGR